MTELRQIYKCNICGNMVEVVRASGGTLTCCGQPMALLDENTVDASKEKHVPVVERIDGGYRIKVGSVAHPMEEKHYIEWVQLIAGDKAYRKHFQPGEVPQAEFAQLGEEADQVFAREYCNLHGLWKG